MQGRSVWCTGGLTCRRDLEPAALQNCNHSPCSEASSLSPLSAVTDQTTKNSSDHSPTQETQAWTQESQSGTQETQSWTQQTQSWTYIDHMQQPPVFTVLTSQSVLSDSPSSQSVLFASPSSQTVLSVGPTSQTVLSNSPSSQTVLSDSPSSQTVLSDSPLSQTVLSDSPSSQSVLSDSPSSQTVLSDSVSSPHTDDTDSTVSSAGFNPSDVGTEKFQFSQVRFVVKF